MSDTEALFAAHQTGVLRYLTRVVGHPETARDLTQEVFLRISRTTTPRGSGAELRGWVFRIARNLALNHLRDRGRQPQSDFLSDTATLQPGQELRVAVQQALARLTDADRDVFLFKEVAGLSYEELAAACELTVDAVRSRLHRARIQLRQDLGEHVDKQNERTVRIGKRR